MTEHTTYSDNNSPHRMEQARENAQGPLLLNSFQANEIGNSSTPQNGIDLEPAIHQILEQFDDAWRELGRL
jgi:hypothetical protein